MASANTYSYTLEVVNLNAQGPQLQINATVNVDILSVLLTLPDTNLVNQTPAAIIPFVAATYKQILYLQKGRTKLNTAALLNQPIDTAALESQVALDK